jgi:eukaryotic translation initiation factor 2C
MAGISVTEVFPMRPSYGTRGKPVILWANYFNLTPDQDLVIHRYHVSMSPEAKGRKIRRLFELLIEHPLLVYSVTDFKSFLLNHRKLEDMEVEILYRSELEDDTQPNTSPYRAKVQNTGEMEVAALLNHLQSTQADPNLRPEKKEQIIQALNVLLGHHPQKNMAVTTIASNKHFSFGVKSIGYDLGGCLHALRGYFRSVRMGTGRLLVNINVSHAVFFKPGPLVDLINEFGKTYGFNTFQLKNS